MPVTVRLVGSLLIIACCRFVCTSVVSRTAGALAVTVIASATADIFSVASTRLVWPTPTSTLRVTVCIPCISITILYVPGGTAAML